MSATDHVEKDEILILNGMILENRKLLSKMQVLREIELHEV